MESTPELSEEAQKLVNEGLSVRVAQKVGAIFATGALLPSELDDRALDALREFNEDGALEVLDQFGSSDLSHVQNKSAFLCGVMKTYREKNRQKAQGHTPGAENLNGPNEEKIKALLDRTGYTLDITTGQRKYGGPPPNWEGPPPGTGSEVPRDCFEDELIPILEECGRIYDFRLMMDPLTNQNRGYGFCTYSAKEEAQDATKKLDTREVRPGRRLGVCLSVANNRLFVGSIPKMKNKDEIMEEFSKVTQGLTDVIVYMSAENKSRNRGFAFLEYESHQAASLARRRLASGRVKVWGNINVLTVDWADPQEEPDADVMSKVKVLYVRNVSPNITEEQLKEKFVAYGAIERAKKIKDYAFIHFVERDHALKALEELNNFELDNLTLEVSLAKPQPTNKDRRRGGQSGYGSMNTGRGSRGGPPRGGPPGRGRGGYGGGDRYGYNDGYERGYDDYEGYGGGYGQRDDYGDRGGYGDNYYDDYYGGGAAVADMVMIVTVKAQGVVQGVGVVDPAEGGVVVIQGEVVIEVDEEAPWWWPSAWKRWPSKPWWTQRWWCCPS
ncbi:hypothetical protein OS493_013745 [Desmophyllum pertusum]|uniref:RRM domain-containing protein n=1 Tax=Desmophyllum pertusum TaxID=174260 RepID=A0A9W9ZRB3_9CNID|nr:hypothetical protein OS493_013745 [Desmophyllum pertusum]